MSQNPADRLDIEPIPPDSSPQRVRWIGRAPTRTTPVAILVLSDTHLPRGAKELPGPILDAAGGADLILHAGDLVALAVWEQLASVAPVLAVVGNGDSTEVRERLPRRILLQVGPFRIGLVHGDEGRGKTIERAWAAFRQEEVEGIVFGHSHQPFLSRVDRVLLLNPGSPTDKRREPEYSFGWLRIGESLEAELIHFGASPSGKKAR